MEAPTKEHSTPGLRTARASPVDNPPTGVGRSGAFAAIARCHPTAVSSPDTGEPFAPLRGAPNR